MIAEFTINNGSRGLPMRKVLYMFGLLSDVDVQWIAKKGVLKPLGDGDVVTHEGEHTDALIFILEGEFIVSNLALGQFARRGLARSSVRSRWSIPRRRPRP